jgi:hypothetical protein
LVSWFWQNVSRRRVSWLLRPPSWPFSFASPLPLWLAFQSRAEAAELVLERPTPECKDDIENKSRFRLLKCATAHYLDAAGSGVSLLILPSSLRFELP